MLESSVETLQRLSVRSSALNQSLHRFPPSSSLPPLSIPPPPPRKRSGYSLFYSSYTPSSPEMTFYKGKPGYKSKIVASKWKAMTEEERGDWNRRAGNGGEAANVKRDAAFAQN